MYDYDLVILGRSPAAAAAAERAARQRARVAWVDPPASEAEWQAERAWRGFHVLREMLQHRQERFGSAQDAGAQIDLAQVRTAAELSDPWLQRGDCSRWGVDWVQQPGSFLRDRQHLGVWIGTETAQTNQQFSSDSNTLSGNGRMLRGRRYLLAPTAQLRPAPLSPLAKTLHHWIDWPDWPESVAIIGAEPEALALAQLLARVGCRVLLLLPQTSAASSADSSVRFVRSLLAASGIAVVPAVELSALQLSQAENNQIQIQTPERCDRVEQVLVATDWQPQLEGLNLAAADLTQPLRVDAKLKTSNPQIYAAGGAIAGDGRDARAMHQAQVAAQHALWSPWRSPRPLPQPHVLWTVPPLVQIGLSQTAAERQYPGQIWRLRSEAPANWRMQLADCPVGFCELVVHQSGLLLGATVMAAEATEWMGSLAIALHQNLSVEQLTTLPVVSPSFSQLLLDAASQFRGQRLAAKPRREDLLERFFNWRRTGGI